MNQLTLSTDLNVITAMSKASLINVCAFFTQLEERATADCMPKLAAHAYKQYCRYRMRLNARRVTDVG